MLTWTTFSTPGTWPSRSPTRRRAYQLAVTVAQYAEVLRASPWAQETSYRQVLGEAARIAELLPEDGEVQEFAQLVSRASQMAGG